MIIAMCIGFMCALVMGIVGLTMRLTFSMMSFAFGFVAMVLLGVCAVIFALPFLIVIFAVVALVALIASGSRKMIVR